MDVELLEIRDFLAQQPPFSLLTAEQLDPLPQQMAIRYLRRGTPFPPAEVEKEYLYLLRQGAVELRGDQRQLIDQYAEGDLYSARCQGGNPEREMRGEAIEDTLLYLLPCDVVAQLCRSNPAFSNQLDSSMRMRLKQALTLLHKVPFGDNRLLQNPVTELIRREPVHVGSDTTIRDAARTMSEQRVSALLVIDQDELVGIVTDRDLRTRCIAEELDTSRPIASIMTSELESVGSEATAFEALLHMTRLNIHHMPVVDLNKVRGLVTHGDILQMERSHAIYLAAQIKRAESLSELERIAGRLPELQMQLIEQGNSAHQLGQVLAALHDALTLRLLQLAEAELGPAPVPYCWFVMGSMARREPTVTSDQDNALVLDDSYIEEQHGDYFVKLADFVCEGLNLCGIVYCPGEMMAANPRWRQTVSQWRETFDGWFRAPSEQAVMEACNFLDLRAVAGRKRLLREVMETVLPKAREHEAFMAALAHNVLQHRPPLGFFRNLVLQHDEQHSHQLDLKGGGLMPIISLARYYATLCACSEMNTLARLEAASKSDVISDDGAAELSDAFHFIATLRARHQVRQIQHEEVVSPYLDPSELSALERRHLKDAFRMVQRQHQLLRQRTLDSGTA